MSIRSRLAVLGLLVLTGCSPKAEHSAAQAQAPVVSVAKVVKVPINEWDQFTGRLQSPEQVEIRPRVSGYIDKVAFTEGSLVQKGDLLFQIDPRPFAAEVKRLEAELQSATAKAHQARMEAQRAKRLKGNAMSTEQADARETTALAAEATVNATAAALDAARLNLEYTEVRAPVSGRVSRAYITAGNLVNAGSSLLTSVVSTKAIYAYFDADEQRFIQYNDLARQGLRQGARDPNQVVLMGLAGQQGFPFTGHIDFLDNQVNPDTGTIRVRAVFNNDDGRLTPGMFARIKWVASNTYPALLIKDTAIGTDLGKKFVLVMDDKHQLNYRTVTLGPRLEGGLRIVRDGLKATDTIVVNGLQRVRPGATISPDVVPMATDSELQLLAATKAPKVPSGTAQANTLAAR
ncbi:efflux RND transporter periplasmic adaptor subunit [Gallaecimonas pentaromativorans]|uniref:Multidrug efflux system membrane fusion protein n=1 Tax=Gallaecimonas pentaromativorans TaxID=584787 RepID=A0A3N1PNP9_9GAMM|nr:efflux RND transporter periplasmic adaptor subunit [Gallaecimonas pentaromativorans]ROQ29789.1 multidrug efflux system membrane fusion protein [Gallaecimonas pentaromativorans]